MSKMKSIPFSSCTQATDVESITVIPEISRRIGGRIIVLSGMDKSYPMRFTFLTSGDFMPLSDELPQLNKIRHEKMREGEVILNHDI